jgi:neutral ceramidase
MRLLLLLLFAFSLAAADYKVGIGRVDITPAGPIWLSGYAARKKPSDGVLQRLWAKALAIEDRKGGRIVIVTTDLLGLPRSVTDVVGARIAKDYAVDRARVLFNSSHTHSGPVVRPNLTIMYDLTEEQDRVIREYTQRLIGDLTSVVAAALGDLKPADIAFGTGEAKFASNRRLRAPDGSVRNAQNPEGPVDHSVPVLRITGEKGETRAVLFGYACHNTTLTAEHHKISGDYAGFAQAALEERLGGATALFLELCAGDQNPYPRSTEELAVQHGSSLANAVKSVLDSKLQPVKGEVAAALQWRELALQPHTREDFEKMLSDKDPIRVRFAKEHLRAYDERRPMRSVQLPVQAVRIGKDTIIVALGGEPVVAYALQTKAAHPKLRLIVAGYSNDVLGYVPTAKMLDEGGYEPISSSMYYGLAATFTKNVESDVLETIRSVIARVTR